MASKPDAEDLGSKLSKLDIQSSLEAELTIANWNVDGSADAKHRQAVTFPLTEDLQTDIVCLQEMSATYRLSVFKKYVAYDTHHEYGVEETSEGPGKYNTVLYKKERFTQDLAWTGHSNQAFVLMEVKLEAYKDIEKVVQGRETWNIDELPQRTLQRLKHRKAFPEIEDELLDRCIREALEEYKTALKGDYRTAQRDRKIRTIDEILQRYKPPKSVETQSPKKLLPPRLAMILLRTNPTKIPILVISVHSPLKVHNSENFNYLLFEFLETIAELGHDYPVLLAGDFNNDIVQSRSLRKFLGHYNVPEYKLTPLRGGRKIDFILLRRPSVRSRYTFRLSGVEAIEFDIPEGTEREMDQQKKYQGKSTLEKKRAITNHSPLRATLEIWEKTEHK